MTAITPEERQLLIETLHSGGEAIIHAAHSLTPAQWTYQPAAGAWSIAAICEHIELVERTILAQLDAPNQATPESLAKAAGKDQFVVRAVLSRRRRVQAPEQFLPVGAYATPAAFLLQFEITRNETLARAQNPSLDLRGFCASHPALQELDGYQWLLLAASHTLRHLEQIKEVRAGADFPPGA